MAEVAAVRSSQFAIILGVDRIIGSKMNLVVKEGKIVLEERPQQCTKNIAPMAVEVNSSDKCATSVRSKGKELCKGP